MSDTETEVNATPAAVDLAEEHGVDLSEVEGTGQDGRITVDDVRALLVDEDEDEPEVEVVGPVAPLVRPGMWVRLKHKGTPGHMVNRDLCVLQAAIRRSNGPTDVSDENVEYQLPSDPLLVRNRETGEEFNVPVSQVAVAVQDRAKLGGGR